jgi:4-amino-4-deoxy-L-arabinose transferase-like glycosyltransferase
MKTNIREAMMKAVVATDRAVPRTFSAVTVLACAWPALLLATVCLLPYLNKPFIIDDPHFLMMAQQIVKAPTHPMDFTVCWITPPGCWKAYALTPGNALMGYVLVPTVLSGAHEWTAHLTQLALAWIAVLAMTSLVLRFGWDRQHAIAGALLLVAIAPFMPMASTAMPDILATAVALVAMERLAAWKADQKWSQGAAAAIALGLAGFARSHLALLLPLAAFYLLDNADPREFLGQLRRKFWLWTPVLAGSALLAAIIALTREHGDLAINPPPVFTGFSHVKPNLLAYLLYLVFPFPLAACWLANRLKIRSLRAAIFVVVAECVALFGHFVPRRATLVAAVGLAVLVDLLYEAWDRAEHDRLILTLWILIPLPIVYYGHLPPKYLLPCMPAVILLCFRLMEGFSVRFLRAGAIALIVASTGYSLLILHSDAEFAWFGRDAMYHLIQPHVAAGETVWFDGQFSAYWYAPLAGATQTFAGGPQPKPGDLLVVGLSEDGQELVLPRFPHRTLVGAETHQYSFGRTTGAGIGLYSNRIGYWMWGFGSSPYDRYELWKID